MKFRDLSSKKTLILDGAVGTYLSGLTREKCIESLNITSPDIVTKMHLDYANAGADIVKTNTFNANSHKLKRFGLDNKVREINETAVRLAKKTGKIVAASIGPIEPTLKRKTPEEIYDIYQYGLDLFANNENFL